MAYEKIGYTNPFAHLPVFPFARLPVCPFARLPVLPFARFLVCPFARLAVWPFGRLAVRLRRYMDLGTTPHHLHMSNCDQPDINFQVIGTTYSVIVNSISRDMILIIYQKCFRKKLKSLCEC